MFVFIACSHYKQRRAQDGPDDFEKRTPARKAVSSGKHKGLWAVHVYDSTSKKLRTEYFKDVNGARGEEVVYSVEA